MNEFLDKLGVVARQAAHTVGTDLTIAVHEQKLRESYQALGKLYYHYVSSGLLPEGAGFDEKIGEVEAELKTIRQLRSQRNVE